YACRFWSGPDTRKKVDRFGREGEASRVGNGLAQGREGTFPQGRAVPRADVRGALASGIKLSGPEGWTQRGDEPSLGSETPATLPTRSSIRWPTSRAWPSASTALTATFCAVRVACSTSLINSGLLLGCLSMGVEPLQAPTPLTLLQSSCRSVRGPKPRCVGGRVLL